jgi:hypothetical protein
MAEYQSNIYALQAAPTAKSMADPIKVYGGLAFIEATYTIVSGTATNDTLLLAQVPANFCLLDHLSSVASDGACGSAGTFTIDVGDTDDTVAASANRYADGLDVAAAGVDLFNANSAAQRLTPYTTRKTCNIYATFLTVSSPEPGAVLVFKMVFACL